MENRTASEMLYESIKKYLPKDCMSKSIIDFYVENAIEYEILMQKSYYLNGIEERMVNGANWRSFNENPECNGK
jgi:hypothetical protein